MTACTTGTNRSGVPGHWVLLAALAVAQTIGCSSPPSAATTPSPSPSSATTRFKGDVWADNWFAFYLGESKVAEDSVPITTERSFNAETFFFDGRYPLELNFVVRDYIQNDTGLEYIGTPNQQMGDGGFIMQITDVATGRVVAASSQAVKCLVIHKAPLNPGCEKDPNPSASCQSLVVSEPPGWKAPGFDTSTWASASVYTPAQVGVKEGYLAVAWDPSARLIWTSDLKADNTLVCKLTVAGP